MVQAGRDAGEFVRQRSPPMTELKSTTSAICDAWRASAKLLLECLLTSRSHRD